MSKPLIDVNKILRENAELLAKFKIQTEHIRLLDSNGEYVEFVITGGAEVLVSASTAEEIDEAMLSLGSEHKYLNRLEANLLPFKYVETPFQVSKLKELLVHKPIDKYSKEDALKLNKDIKSKQELEEDIVYIVDKQPTTNTLALAKQFDLNHMHVINKLYELGSIYPSTLMQLKYDVYSDISKSGGKKPNTENSESVISNENSLDIKSHKSYASFIHITEDVYYKFVKKISTPMNVNSKDRDKRASAMTKLVHIESKQDEYFEAFKKVRDFLLESDTSSKELEAMMRIRTHRTKELMSEIYNYVTNHNVYHKDNQYSLVNFNKYIFNIVNYLNNINAVNYVPRTDNELLDGETRQTKRKELQQLIAETEIGITVGLSFGLKHNVTPIDLITVTTNMTENDIKNALHEYNADYLWDMITSKNNK